MATSAPPEWDRLTKEQQIFLEPTKKEEWNSLDGAGRNRLADSAQLRNVLPGPAELPANRKWTLPDPTRQTPEELRRQFEENAKKGQPAPEKPKTDYAEKAKP
jgi:hypothetical protein